jgi:hypothetical protein
MFKYKSVASHPTLIKMSCYSKMVNTMNYNLVAYNLFYGLYLDVLENFPGYNINKNNLMEEKNDEYKNIKLVSYGFVSDC